MAPDKKEREENRLENKRFQPSRETQVGSHEKRTTNVKNT